MTSAELITRARAGAVAAGRHVLAIQGATELNHQALARRVSGHFVAFTGTPVAIYFESRLVRLSLKAEQLPQIDDEVDELSENEIRFYETLKKIAHELIESLWQNIIVDWSARESARARLRLMVKRILRKYKYPLDLQEIAMDLVLQQQAEALGEAWSA